MSQTKKHRNFLKESQGVNDEIRNGSIKLIKALYSYLEIFCRDFKKSKLGKEKMHKYNVNFPNDFFENLPNLQKINCYAFIYDPSLSPKEAYDMKTKMMSDEDWDACWDGISTIHISFCYACNGENGDKSLRTTWAFVMHEATHALYDLKQKKKNLSQRYFLYNNARKAMDYYFTDLTREQNKVLRATGILFYALVATERNSYVTSTYGENIPNRNIKDIQEQLNYFTNSLNDESIWTADFTDIFKSWFRKTPLGFLKWVNASYKNYAKHLRKAYGRSQTEEYPFNDMKSNGYVINFFKKLSYFYSKEYIEKYQKYFYKGMPKKDLFEILDNVVTENKNNEFRKLRKRTLEIISNIYKQYPSQRRWLNNMSRRYFNMNCFELYETLTSDSNLYILLYNALFGDD